MWLERFTIVVPSLSNPRAPVHTFVYRPTWVEWSLMAGCFAAFALLYMGFTKLFPDHLRSGSWTTKRRRRRLPQAETRRRLAPAEG